MAAQPKSEYLSQGKAEELQVCTGINFPTDHVKASPPISSSALRHIRPSPGLFFSGYLSANVCPEVSVVDEQLKYNRDELKN